MSQREGGVPSFHLGEITGLRRFKITTISKRFRWTVYVAIFTQTRSTVTKFPNARLWRVSLTLAIYPQRVSKKDTLGHAFALRGILGKYVTSRFATTIRVSLAPLA